MKYIKSIIGHKMFIGSFVLVIAVCSLARFAFVQASSPQQRAAQDIATQQKTVDANIAAFNAYNAAKAKMQTDENCIHDATTCSFQ